MRNKRRRSSLCNIASLEQSFRSSDTCSARPRRRKSNLSVLSKIENSIENKGASFSETGECMIPCGQSENAENTSGLFKMETDNSLFAEELNSDDDLFANQSPVKSEATSPILSNKNTPSLREHISQKLSTSFDWGGDDTLIVKCSEELLKSTDENHNADNDKPHSLAKYSSDSVFGDIDLSLLENQMCNIDNKEHNGNAESIKSNNENYPTTVVPSPVSKNVNSEQIQSSKPVAASTPSRSGGPGKLMRKLKERLKANASKQTSTSFHFRDAAKIFPEIMGVGSDSQLESQTLCKNLGPFYGLPIKVKELMESIRGIKKFYDWQQKCLSLNSVLEGKNLIYSLPTSGGKTLVAEILIMKELLCKERDAILVLPFVAIVQEKVRNIAQFADALDFLVEEYAGSKGKIPPMKRRKRKSLFICTIEKANSLVNALIEGGRLDSVGLVVVDELHMIGEGGRRGATIEMMLAKIQHVSSTTQVIGMSATLSNISDLAKFLQSDVYTNDFRPVTLDEHVKYNDSIYKVDPKKLNPDEKLEFFRPIGYASKEMSNKDTDHLATMLLEVIPEHSCLIFCPTKKNCENVAVMICKLLPGSLRELKVKEKKAILETLYQDSGGKGVCPVLMKTLPYGIAYHHSGLTSDERRLIEDAYTDGVLCALTCTSTLAAGVNLPARRVIIRSPYVGMNFLSRAQYKQMVGRAGRAGIDTKGESFLIMTKQQDKQKIMDLVTGPIETCVSSLTYDGGKGFKTLVLNLIGLKIMTKLSDVKDFFSRTLISVQLNTMPERFSYLSNSKNSSEDSDADSMVENVTKTALQELLDLKLIKLGKSKEDDNTPDSSNIEDFSLETTKLGAATNRGSIDLSISNIVYDDLKVGLKSLVLINYLHLLYLVTPHDVAVNIKPKWMLYFEEYGKLTPDEQTAATLIGVPENYVAMKAAGNRVRNKKYKDEVISRFYVTLMLYQLFRGRSIWDVASRFEQPRGFLQTLLSSSAAFASCLLHFTKELEEFWPYHALLEKLIQCLQYCTTAELLPLMEIPGVKIARAKQLYNAGFKCLAQIAKAEVEKLLKCVEHLSRRQALQIIASAKVLLKEKIEELQAEAEELQTVPNLS